jgi:phospholipase B1
LQDIKVIAALGDSITAAFAADGLEGGPLEYRGQSWSIGGDPNATTLANFFKNYSPEVQGASVGVHTPEVCLGVEFCPDGQYWPTMDNLNSAQSGAWIQNWPRMFDFLMKQMQSNPKIDYQKDWKVLTVFIGANVRLSSCNSRCLRTNAIFCGVKLNIEPMPRVRSRIQCL